MRIVVLFLFVIVFSMSCHEQTEYDRLLKSELARNVRYDSLFLGLHFDMSKKDFYTSCWEMNKQGLIIQGPGNLSVEYKLDSTQLKSPAYMRFYPNFKNDKIHVMPVEFIYEAWAPWNQHLSADSLLLDVKNMFERWYGGSFIYLEDESGNIKLWVKIDGNRRIRIYVKNISTVKAEFVNLLEING
ncbi:MAG TPA: hypothetical protein PKC24_07375 [Cyclobacteriaceae bacterium]|nr:hypothetical protein [Cyclobacteriaceae bacterium]